MHDAAVYDASENGCRVLPVSHHVYLRQTDRWLLGYGGQRPGVTGHVFPP